MCNVRWSKSFGNYFKNTDEDIADIYRRFRALETHLNLTHVDSETETKPEKYRKMTKAEKKASNQPMVSNKWGIVLAWRG